MGKPKAPTPPDPMQTAGAQTANNIGTAITQQALNSVNQITPTGKLTYYIQGANGELINPADYSAGGFNGANPAPAPAPQPVQPATPAPRDETIAYERGNAAQPSLADPAASQPQELPQPVQTQSPDQGGFQYTDPNTGQVYTIPQYTAVQELSPEEQAIFNSGQATRQNLADLAADASQRMGEHLSQGMDFNSLPSGGSASNVNAPEYQRVDGLRALDGNLRTRTGELTRDVGPMTFGAQIGDAGEIHRTFGDAGEITRTYGRDYSEDRRRVEEALMSRLNPSLERDRESLRSSLINQGIREGSEAFDRAMNRADEASTDARFQAILAGGQEQTRMDDMEARRAGFQNAAQQQEFMQALTRGQFSNDAQQQLFGQNRDQAQLGLQAQQAQANFDLARANFSNQATMDAFNQDLAALGVRNAAITGNNANLFNAANFNNNVSSQEFGNDLTMQGRMDQDRAQALNEMLMARNQPINEIGALLGTGQVQMPNFVNPNTPNLANTDVAGIINNNYAQQMQAYNQQMAAQNNLWGGILGAGGKIAGALI